jgi:MoaA/NifB/PqqE/SkfB family radical SAM enzyme
VDLTIISTYRCNSRCSTCHIWKYPTRPTDEIPLEVLEKIPSGIDNLNISGGEPTLRADLADMVDILHPKARKLEISTNGIFPYRLEPIIKKYPDIKIRFSLEGSEEVNNAIRGEKNGFQIKVNGLQRLKDLGGRDLGFAITIQDENIQSLAFLYHLTQEMKVELATSALHNGFQFHKNDNYPYDRLSVAQGIQYLITEMLRTNSVKNWFRAYLNLGLMEKILGNDRLIPCTAASDFVFIDPWCDVYACNVRCDLLLGNLGHQTWQQIYHSSQFGEARQKVSSCPQNCWMVGSARTAMRNSKFTRFPKFKPLQWVFINKIRVSLNLPINFRQYINFDNAGKFESGSKRTSHLNDLGITRNLHQEQDEHYNSFGPFINR